MAPNWPLELTSLMVRRNGCLNVHPLSGLRGFKLSCAGHREKLGSLPSMLELASNEDTAKGSVRFFGGGCDVYLVLMGLVKTGPSN